MPQLKYIALTLAFVGLIVLYVLEFSWFDRTMGVQRLVMWSMAVGLIVGLALGWRYRNTTENLTEKIQVYVFFTVMCTIFAPLAGSLSNRLLSPYPIYEQEAMFIEERPYLSEPLGFIQQERPKPTGYYTFFYYNGKLRRIKNEDATFPGLQRGETIVLRMRKGLWGPEVVMKGQQGAGR